MLCYSHEVIRLTSLNLELYFEKLQLFVETR